MMLMRMMSNAAAPPMVLARAAMLRGDDNGDSAPMYLAQHMTLGRGGDGHILPKDANNEGEKEVAADAATVVVKGRVIVDAHARLRRVGRAARSRRSRRRPATSSARPATSSAAGAPPRSAASRRSAPLCTPAAARPRCARSP
jgi:hypothetical protein